VALVEADRYLVLSVTVVVGEGAGGEWGGDGVGGNGSIDEETVEWHLIDLLLERVEVLDGGVGGLARGLHAVYRTNVERIEAEVLFIIVGPDQDGWRQRRVLQGFEDGDALPA
jgi:hypothetical protein